jgi:hypothetical protein
MLVRTTGDDKRDAISSDRLHLGSWRSAVGAERDFIQADRTRTRTGVGYVNRACSGNPIRSRSTVFYIAIWPVPNEVCQTIANAGKGHCRNQEVLNAATGVQLAGLRTATSIPR